MSNQTNQRIEKDFTKRSLEDQQDFIDNTWCDQCQMENLGLSEPSEYEIEGITFIEGKCVRCKNIVITELTDDDF